jgi:energy-coupling factor transporter ATP-binding protein EcfA2
MPDCERSFYLKLSAKLEPIRQISPHPDLPRETVGFEMLALDAAGRSFTSIEHFVKRKQYDPAVHFAIMIYVAVLTIQYMRTVLPLRDRQIHASSVFFTINLTPYMVGHPRLFDVFHKIRPLVPESFILEVSEKLLSDKVDELLRFQETFGFKLALDDLDELDPGVRRALEDHVVMTKIGFRKSRLLLAHREHNPDLAMDGLRRFKLEGRPLVVEAIDEDLSQVFLYDQWKPEWGDLFVQGRDLTPGPLYEPHLIPLNQFHIRGGGFVLAADQKRPLYRDLFSACCSGLDITGCREAADTLRATFTSRSAQSRRFTVTALTGEPGAWAEEDLRELAADADYIVAGTQPPETLLGGRPWIPEHRLAAFLKACARALLQDQPLPQSTADIHAFIAQHVPDPHPAQDPADPHRDTPANMTRTDALDLLLRWTGIISDTEDAREHSLPRILALLGDTGSGKSTLVRRLAAALWQDRANAATPMPVLLDAAHLAGRTRAAMAAGGAPTLEQYIAWTADHAGAGDIDTAALLAAVHAGRAVILCDGFDTLCLPLTRSQSMALMRNLRAAAPPHTHGRLLVAARTHFFLDAMDEEERLLAGEDAAMIRSRDSGRLLSAYIEPLNREQIATLSRRRAGAPAADALMQALDASPALRNLCARPSLLAALCSLSAAAQPINPGAALLDTLVKIWLGRDDFIHQLRPDVKLRFMEALAVKLRQEADSSIHYESLYRWLRARLRQEFPSLESVDEVERLDNDLRAASFLIRNTGGYYRIAHPALQDYFAARFVARGLSDGDPESLEAQGLSPDVLALAAGIVRRPPFRADVAQATARILLHSSRNPDAANNARTLLHALKK